MLALKNQSHSQLTPSHRVNVSGFLTLSLLRIVKMT